MIKHSILKQTSEGLVIDLYFSDRPQIDSYVDDLIYWLSHPDKTVKVDEGSKQRFLDEYVSTSISPETIDWSVGIEISPDMFEVHRKYSSDLKKSWEELAFFKEEKEETQEDIYEQLFKIIYDPKTTYVDMEYLIRENFEIKRRKG